MNDIEDPQIKENANNSSSLLLGHVDLGKSTKNVDESAKSVCGIESRPQMKRFLDSPQAARPKTIFICGLALDPQTYYFCAIFDDFGL